MRIRCKKWAKPELMECPFYIKNPIEHIGKWKELYKKEQPFYLELGCGKGSFIAEMASRHPDINYLAIDVVDSMLGLAKRNIERVYEDKKIPIDNVYITKHDIQRILLIMNEKDVVDRIYINFCNPWPKNTHKKRRLTYTRQLEHYKVFLKQDGEIYFKTDDDELFEDSINYLIEQGFEIIWKTYDLHKENITENIETEHEKMFSDEGILIKALIARKR